MAGRIDPSNSDNLNGDGGRCVQGAQVCEGVCACVRACVHACMRACCACNIR